MPVPENARRIERAERRVNELRAWRNAAESPLESWTLTTADGTSYNLSVGDAWPVVELPVTLKGSGDVPTSWVGQPVDLELWLGGEAIIFLNTGLSAGLNPYHHKFKISDALEQGFTLTVDAEVSPKGLFGANVPQPRIDRAHVVIPHREIQNLALDLGIALETAEALEDHHIVPQLLDAVENALSILSPVWPTDTATTINRHLLGYLNPLGTGVNAMSPHSQKESSDVMPFYSDMGGLWSEPDPTGGLEPLSSEVLAVANQAGAYFATELDRLRTLYPPIGNDVLTGHAHIDLAWLWPTHETRRKLRRTFNSVLSLMDQYEDFTFNQSSAQAYAWIEKDDPELFERVKVRIAEGRWDVPGGMWLEPDCEVTGGEAMARQILYGQQYFQKHFGLRSRSAWLPDVFGFSGGIPQLLQLGGMTGFFTHKLNWNETNTFPHDLFTWEGIDGSTVTAWMSRTIRSFRGYNADIQAIDTYGSWADFDGKRYHPETMVVFGWGDGGGGPTAIQLDRYARLKDYPAIPRLRMGIIDDYQDSLPKSGLPVWMGELNLELHRGTLTSQGLVKKLNREAESRLFEAEALGAVASLLADYKYPLEALSTAWKTTLLNQFHDILPGSSIHEVYEDTHREMHDAVATAVELRDNALSAIGGNEPGIIIGNASAAQRQLVVAVPTAAAEFIGPAVATQQIDNGLLVASTELVPGIGVVSLAGVPADAPTIEPVTVSQTSDTITLESTEIAVTIASDGSIASLLHKPTGRSVFSDHANQLWGYLDRPRAWDGWDVDERYPHEGFEVGDVASIEVIESGPIRASVRVTRNWRSSSIVQTYRLVTGSGRLDIETDVEWHERRVMLRAHFPLALRAHESVAETIYGVHRRPTHVNTSWQVSHFEKSMHRWVDLSETGFGVAILNDGRYAYGASASEVNIALLRSPIYPDHFADEGHHHFTYSVFPHEGDWSEAEVVEEAIALNSPLVVGQGSLAGEWALLRQSGTPLTLGALKLAEDNDDLILRLHESSGRRGFTRLTFDQPFAGIDAVNLLEETADSLPELEVIDDHTVRFAVKPFQVVTLRIRR
ncbi:glycoside hydrolase family 38 C-terminal domain-containing protein [soil metagenome]